MKKLKNKISGFTLIELLVTIVIVGILVSITIVSLSSHKERSRDARRIAELSSLQSAVELYFQENGSFPDDLSDVASYFDGVLPKDPKTGEDYKYQKVPAIPPQPKQYCLLAELENISSVGNCTDSIPGADALKRYIIQGPL